MHGTVTVASDNWVLLGSNIIDIGTSASPLIVGKRSVGDGCLGNSGRLSAKIEKTGPDQGKLLLIEISNPLAPVIIGQSKLPDRDLSICRQHISGEYLYLLTNKNTILIYRIG
jgi:hypothetical protein